MPFLTNNDHVFQHGDKDFFIDNIIHFIPNRTKQLGDSSTYNLPWLFYHLNFDSSITKDRIRII